MIYHNEASVGEGIRRAGVPRSDFFLTTKLWNDDIRARRGKDAFQESLDRLGVDYVDLYLIHWPADGWQQAWDDLQEIYASGRAKAIGVSNFQKHHIDELLTHSDVVPAVDQVESSPQFTNQELIGQLRAKASQPRRGVRSAAPAVTYSATQYWPKSVPSTASLLHR